ncbi:hypothetical protein MMC15_003912 [Xylographa vitiligo]|nr:hypothetical protein [Xylographa vitiligo]
MALNNLFDPLFSQQPRPYALEAPQVFHLYDSNPWHRMPRGITAGSCSLAIDIASTQGDQATGSWFMLYAEMFELIKSCVLNGHMGRGGTSTTPYGFVFTVVDPRVVNVVNTCMASHGAHRIDVAQCVLGIAIRARQGREPNTPDVRPNVPTRGRQLNLVGPSVINPLDRYLIPLGLARAGPAGAGPAGAGPGPWPGGPVGAGHAGAGPAGAGPGLWPGVPVGAGHAGAGLAGAGAGPWPGGPVGAGPARAGPGLWPGGPVGAGHAGAGPARAGPGLWPGVPVGAGHAGAGLAGAGAGLAGAGAGLWPGGPVGAGHAGAGPAGAGARLQSPGSRPRNSRAQRPRNRGAGSRNPGAGPGNVHSAGADPASIDRADAPMPNDNLDPNLMHFFTNSPPDAPGSDSGPSDTGSTAHRPSRPNIFSADPSDPTPSAPNPAGAGPPGALSSGTGLAIHGLDRRIPAAPLDLPRDIQSISANGLKRIVAGTWTLEGNRWVAGRRKWQWKVQGGWWLALGQGTPSPYPGGVVPIWRGEGAKPHLIPRPKDRPKPPLAEAWIAGDGTWQPLEGAVPPDGPWLTEGGWVLLRGMP